MRARFFHASSPVQNSFTAGTSLAMLMYCSGMLITLVALSADHTDHPNVLEGGKIVGPILIGLSIFKLLTELFNGLNPHDQRAAQSAAVSQYELIP